MAEATNPAAVVDTALGRLGGEIYGAVSGQVRVRIHRTQHALGRVGAASAVALQTRSVAPAVPDQKSPPYKPGGLVAVEAWMTQPFVSQVRRAIGTDSINQLLYGEDLGEELGRSRA